MRDAVAITIISGGQTGADRAALDAAIERGVACGGWCPDGRLAEDGVIPQKYPLVPLPHGSYDDRTLRNVRDADATVILSFGPPTGGSETTRAACIEQGQPLLLLDASALMPAEAGERIAAFVVERGAGTLNVAGPRASEQPGIAAYVREAIGVALNRLKGAAKRHGE